MDYLELCEYYEKIDSNSKRLEKIKYISELISKCEDLILEKVVLLLQGKVFPDWDERKLGVATRLVIKSLNVASGISVNEIEKKWKTTGDLGDAGLQVIKGKKQQSLFSSKLTITKVFDNLQKLATLEGSGSTDSKIQLISELLTSASSLEAKYIIRSVLGELRVGASQGTIREAILKSYFSEIYNSREDEKKEEYKEMSELLQGSYDILNDFSEVISILKEDGKEGLEKVSLETFRPVNPMLFPKAKDVEDGFKIIGKPAIIEYKYDGFRVQVHKKNSDVKLFTRRLEEVTKQFPDIVDVVIKKVKAKECILDAEVLGIDTDTGKMRPFQEISQRIRRKHDIEKISKEVPVILVVFDILKFENESFITKSFKERRESIENVVKEDGKTIKLSTAIKTSEVEEGSAFYEKSLLLGHEGIMMKSLEPGYKPGARIGYAVKVKPVLEPLDLVIIKAEWGHGKRAGWLTSYSVACKDKSKNKFVDIGKVGTGIKELDNEDEAVTFKQFTELLKPLITKEHNAFVEVKPEIIVEVDYEEIQKSSNYSSGYALRFPRIKRIRTDLKEPSTTEDVERTYKEQRGRGE